jgi:hypothetical protein
VTVELSDRVIHFMSSCFGSSKEEFARRHKVSIVRTKVFARPDYLGLRAGEAAQERAEAVRTSVCCSVMDDHVQTLNPACLRTVLPVESPSVLQTPALP